MKSYAGNWQINHNSQNRMSEKMLSERMANEITELLRRDRKWVMDAREDLEQVFFIQNWQNQMTEQYRTICPEIQGFLSDWQYFIFFESW